MSKTATRRPTTFSPQRSLYWRWILTCALCLLALQVTVRGQTKSNDTGKEPARSRGPARGAARGPARGNDPAPPRAATPEPSRKPEAKPKPDSKPRPDARSGESAKTDKKVASPSKEVKSKGETGSVSRAVPEPKNTPQVEADPEGVKFFETRIRPVLHKQCVACHGQDKPKGGFRVDNVVALRAGGDSGPSFVAGQPDDSLLLEALRHDGLKMPPKEKLPDAVIADFEQWIKIGAPLPTIESRTASGTAQGLWSLRPLVAVEPPSVRDTGWPTDSVDRFVLARLESENLQPVDDADRLTWIRRVTFDLIGLPPTGEEIQTFLADTSSQALEKVVDRLLASPHYGERWGRHWLDVARFAESTGRQLNAIFPHAWKYRDYVYDAFEHDVPYDRFICEQIAGDLLPAKDPAEHDRLQIATAYLVIGATQLNPGKYETFRMNIVDDQIDATMVGILGLTVSCARCHDHKFDPIPTADYYALAGIFRSTTPFAGFTHDTSASRQQYLLVPATQSASESGDTTESPPLLQEMVEQQSSMRKLRDELDFLFTQPYEKTKGRRAEIDKELKPFYSRLREIDAELPPANKLNLLMGVRDSNYPLDCRVLERGEPELAKDLVPRGALSVLSRDNPCQLNGSGSGRLELAHWLTSRNNPLTARVFVNRVWLHLFGAGLVETADNFGTQGSEPSHPELLDHLAIRFMDEHHWSVKSLIRSLVLSRTYRLGSQHQPANYATDPGNRLLWRFTRRRVDAEAFRDAILATSGALSLQRPHASTVAFLDPRTGFTEAKVVAVLHAPTSSRSCYLPLVRDELPEVLSTFDMADSSMIVGRRNVTTVATQALFLMNSPFMLEQAELLASRLLTLAPKSEADRITQAYQLCFGRSPTALERERITRYLKELRPLSTAQKQRPSDPELPAWRDVCQALLASADFRYLD